MKIFVWCIFLLKILLKIIKEMYCLKDFFIVCFNLDKKEYNFYLFNYFDYKWFIIFMIIYFFFLF